MWMNDDHIYRDNYLQDKQPRSSLDDFDMEETRGEPLNLFETATHTHFGEQITENSP